MNTQSTARLHFEINCFEPLPKSSWDSTLGEWEKSILNLTNYTGSYRGFTLQTMQNNGEAKQDYLARAQRMRLVIYDTDSPTIVVGYNDKFKVKEFQSAFNRAINDEYNNNTRVELKGFTHRYLSDTYFLYGVVRREDVDVVYTLFYNMLLASARITPMPCRANQADFQKELDSVFRISGRKDRNLQAEVDRLYKEEKFDELYDAILQTSQLPQGKGLFLKYGEYFKNSGDFVQAIRFLNSEPPCYEDTHDRAQVTVFEVMGLLLNQDDLDKKQLFTPEERRSYQRARLELAYRILPKHPEMQRELDLCFCDFLGIQAVGEKKLPYSLATNSFDLVVQLSEEVYRLRNLSINK